jgi:hypothetical protein
VAWTPRDEPLSDVYAPTGNAAEEEEAFDFVTPRAQSAVPVSMPPTSAYGYSYDAADDGATPGFGGNMYQDTRETGWWGPGNSDGNAYAPDVRSTYSERRAFDDQNVVFDDESDAPGHVTDGYAAEQSNGGGGYATQAPPQTRFDFQTPAKTKSAAKQAAVAVEADDDDDDVAWA